MRTSIKNNIIKLKVHLITIIKFLMVQLMILTWHDTLLKLGYYTGHILTNQIKFPWYAAMIHLLACWVLFWRFAFVILAGLDLIIETDVDFYWIKINEYWHFMLSGGRIYLLLFISFWFVIWIFHLLIPDIEIRKMVGRAIKHWFLYFMFSIIFISDFFWIKFISVLVVDITLLNIVDNLFLFFLLVQSCFISDLLIQLELSMIKGIPSDDEIREVWKKKK